jgi:hypothetical protein|tara:strand:+ start:2704 stop:2928 length:225 start_codon:yes stop_codon:yes gene_type:complete
MNKDFIDKLTSVPPDSPQRPQAYEEFKMEAIVLLAKAKAVGLIKKQTKEDIKNGTATFRGVGENTFSLLSQVGR